MQFKLNRSENNKLLSNDVRSSGTNLSVLNLSGNKLRFLNSSRDLTIIHPYYYIKLLAVFFEV